MQPAPMTPPPGRRLPRRRIAMVFGTLASFIVLGVAYRVFVVELTTPKAREQAPTPTEVHVKKTPDPADANRKKPEYVGWDRRTPEQKQQDAPPMAQGDKNGSDQNAGTGGNTVHGTGHTGSSGSGNTAGAGAGHTGTTAQSHDRTAAGTKSPDKPKPPRYMFAEVAVATPPGALVGHESGKPAQPGEPPGESAGPLSGSAQLIQPARMERPEDPTRVWYMSQGLTGITMTEIVSGIPGQVVIRVTRDLMDKNLIATTPLIAQQALVVVTTGSEGISDADRLPVKIRQIELPGALGQVLALQEGQVGDGYGAAGLTGDVNRHFWEKVGAAGIASFLSIGARIPAGNQQNYAPTLGQQTANQFGQSVSETGQEIVRKSLQKKDTITVPAGFPVTIYPGRNINFATDVKVVK